MRSASSYAQWLILEVFEDVRDAQEENDGAEVLRLIRLAEDLLTYCEYDEKMNRRMRRVVAGVRKDWQPKAPTLEAVS